MDSTTRQLLISHGISADLTEHILKITDFGRKNPPAITVAAIPEFSDPRIINLALDTLQFKIKSDKLFESLHNVSLPDSKIPALLKACNIEYGTRHSNNDVSLERGQLYSLGMYLLPLVSFGMLNGGSASSYYDATKNRESSPFLYDHFANLIEVNAEAWANRPKGLSPAFIQSSQNSKSGFSFLELKIRGWLRLIRNYQRAATKLSFELPWHGLERIMPCFQMVSSATQKDIALGFQAASQSPLIQNLAESVGIDISQPLTATQELVSAFTLSQSDGTRGIFRDAIGKPGGVLGLPGGHGQNFHVLADIYRTMEQGGKRFAYLGNIDNLGFIPDPIAIALTALQNCEASFEFAFKTPLDRKGGVLVSTDSGRLTCGDIGQAVSPATISEAEAQHKPILFNCATGLFKLTELCPKLGQLSQDLPVRFSNQAKDAGRYSQAEQTTWEVIGLLQQPLILGVAKQTRFLAAKLFMDCILTSGLGQDLQAPNRADQDLLSVGTYLHQGLCTILSRDYGMVQTNQGWTSED